MTFEQELRALLNKHNIENASQTPDFILADFITRCLMAWNLAVTERDHWRRPVQEIRADL